MSHRPYGRGFYFNPAEADVTVSGESKSRWDLLAQLGGELSAEESESVFARAEAFKKRRRAEYESLVPKAKAAYDERVRNCPDRSLPPAEKKEGWHLYAVKIQNMVTQDSALEAVAPDYVSRPLPAGSWQLLNPQTGEVYRWCCDGHPAVLYTSVALGDNVLLRSPSTPEAQS